MLAGGHCARAAANTNSSAHIMAAARRRPRSEREAAASVAITGATFVFVVTFLRSLIFGFIFCDCDRLLSVEGQRSGRPRLLDLPIGTDDVFLGGIVDHLGLPMGSVIARIPAVVGVGVDREAGVVGGGLQVGKEYAAILHSDASQRLVGGVE